MKQWVFETLSQESFPCGQLQPKDKQLFLEILVVFSQPQDPQVQRPKELIKIEERGGSILRGEMGEGELKTSLWGGGGGGGAW